MEYIHLEERTQLGMKGVEGDVTECCKLCHLMCKNILKNDRPLRVVILAVGVLKRCRIHSLGGENSIGSERC